MALGYWKCGDLWCAYWPLTQSNWASLEMTTESSVNKLQINKQAFNYNDKIWHYKWLHRVNRDQTEQSMLLHATISVLLLIYNITVFALLFWAVYETPKMGSYIGHRNFLAKQFTELRRSQLGRGNDYNGDLTIQTWSNDQVLLDYYEIFSLNYLYHGQESWPAVID
jgi:hypothetical protein